MNINASVRSKCECCECETISIPLNVEDLGMGDDGYNPDLLLTIEEAEQLVQKLQKLITV